MSAAATELGPLLRAQLDALAAQHAALPGAQVPWLGEARVAAREGLALDGLPRVGDEAWKYTTLKPWSEQALHTPDRDAAALDAVRATVDALPAPRLVFVNGIWDAPLSDLRGVDAASLDVQPLTQALQRGADGLCHALSVRFNGRARAFARLAAAWSHQGAVVRVAPGARLDAPLHLVFIGAAAAPGAWHARHVLRLSKGSALQVIEHHIDGHAHATLSNHLWQVQLDDDARLEHVRVQAQGQRTAHLSRIQAELGARASWRVSALELGAQLSRLEVDVALSGQGAQVAVDGASVLRGRQHGDVHLRATHQARDTQSRVQWRGIADERARVVFDGGIVVAAGADGADALLSNKNLLLSAHAEIDTKPLLEIFADEVKAAHGATVGQLDERALFYLRARGVPQATARAMLTYAFAASVFASVQPARVRDDLMRRLAQSLGQDELVNRDTRAEAGP